MFAGKKSAQIREILISESAWEEMTCLFAPSLMEAFRAPDIFMGLGEMYGAFTGRTVQAILIGFQDRFDLSKSIQPLLIRHATGGLKSFHRITS